MKTNTAISIATEAIKTVIQWRLAFTFSETDIDSLTLAKAHHDKARLNEAITILDTMREEL